MNARWTKKNEQNYYGYKDHVVADLASKLIGRAEVTAASEHDSQALDSLTQPGDPETWLPEKRRRAAARRGARHNNFLKSAKRLGFIGE